MLLGAISHQFLAQNIHFAVCLAAALAFFIAGWLYFDSHGKPPYNKIAKYTGFFLIAISFLILGAGGSDAGLLTVLAGITRLAGYLGIIVSELVTPLQPRPHNVGLVLGTPNLTPAADRTQAKPRDSYLPALTLPSLDALNISWLLPFGSGLACLLYLRRATIGLERHLLGLAIVFGCLTLVDIMTLANLWQAGDNPILHDIIRPLGPLWIIHHLAILLISVLLLRWVWRYLTEQPQTQMFLLSTVIMAVITFVTTATVTSLLLINLEKTSLASLETAAKTLTYAIDSQAAITRADATIITRSPAVIGAVSTKDHAALAKIEQLTGGESRPETIIADRTGQVLLRSFDPDRHGDSLSDNPLIKQGLAGQTTSATLSRPGALAPALFTATVSPIRQENSIVGVVLSSRRLDTAFVDGIKATTGLDSTIYNGAIRTATTLVGPDGTSRFIGATEANSSVTTTVLKQGRAWHGSLNISNRPFLAIYLPLKDTSGTVIGMLSVAQPATVLYETTTQAIRLTYLCSILWLILAIPPMYLIIRQITRQLR